MHVLHYKTEVVHKNSLEPNFSLNLALSRLPTVARNQSHYEKKVYLTEFYLHVIHAVNMGNIFKQTELLENIPLPKDKF